MEPHKSKRFKIVYLAFLLPFILAYLSWLYFPMLAQWLISHIFKYQTAAQANWLWYLTTRLFYTWYTLLAIGVAGIWALAATFARMREKKVRNLQYPMVSFVVPAYDEEKNIPRCIDSLFKCAERYDGLCEIIAIDDGSRDFTYEIAWSAIELNRKSYPRVLGKVARHFSNLGKIEAIKTGVNKAQGSVIAVVDADSWWLPDTLVKLVDYMILNQKKALTGYVHPSDGDSEINPYVVLQQLEYSQGLGLNRCAQSLADRVMVVPGAMGLFDADVFRQILNEENIRSVTEDLEITLNMQKKGAKVDYVSLAASSTIAPTTFNVLWNQRSRWFAGWLHNTLNIHRDLLLKRSWATMLVWYSYIFEYAGALVDLAALATFPLLFWFAPDRIYFMLNLLVFVPYGLLIGIANQTIALKYAYDSHNYRSLLFYTPFYPILRLINILARVTSLVRYFFGDHGSWVKKHAPT
jgi:cellulose synthase/poly-beta-1,6-N-acetylglucosamine synthase-like glycosyltransferase